MRREWPEGQLVSLDPTLAKKASELAYIRFQEAVLRVVVCGFVLFVSWRAVRIVFGLVEVDHALVLISHHDC